MARTKKAPAVATVAERQANSRAQRAAAGGKAITVMLTPEAAASLAKLQRNGAFGLAAGESIAAIVNHYITKATRSTRVG
jgi:hypothetical protein